MKTTLKLVILFLLICNQTFAVEANPSVKPAPAVVAEPWKGQTIVQPLELGLLTGLSIFGAETAWSVLGTAAYLLKEKQFAPDLDNRIWVELELGPSFFGVGNSHQTGLQYSTHLRWDFNYNELWTFYALGGFSGFSLPKAYGNEFTFHPRFGTGVQYQTKSALLFRGEVSAEFIGLGVSFNF